MKITKGEYLGIYKEKKLTFRQFAPVISPTRRRTRALSSYHRDRIAVDRWLIPVFGERYLFDITLTAAERYKQHRLEAVEPATVNKEVNCLKAMLNKAVSWGYLKENPLKGMSALKEPPGRLRYLMPEETTRLLAACDTPPYFRPSWPRPCIRACGARKSLPSTGGMWTSAGGRLPSVARKTMNGR